MFSGIWAKITGALSVIVAILLAFVGYQRKEIKKKDHEIKVKDFENESAKQQIVDEKEVLNNEPIEIKEEIEKRANLDRSNRIKRL